MSELQVTVQQTPGTIHWNFEELKKELAIQMDQYKSIVYTDENIGEAKKDVAALRKLEKAVDARRIEIKNKCLEPYQVIEEQAKELESLIREPIRIIAKKVDDYESRRKAAKKERIIQFMEKTFAGLPMDVKKRLECKAYDARWENAGTADKVWKEAVQAALTETQDALTLLSDVDEDFREQVFAVYKVDLNLTRAMMKASELQKQKEMLIEKERQRQEQERIRKEREKRAAEEAERQRQEQERIRQEQERIKREQEKRAAEEAERRAQEAQNVVSAAPKQEAEENKAEEEKTEQRAATAAQPQPGKVKEEPKKIIYSCVVKMAGTSEQIRKAIDYAGFIGVKCEVQK